MLGATERSEALSARVNAASPACPPAGGYTEANRRDSGGSSAGGGRDSKREAGPIRRYPRFRPKAAICGIGVVLSPRFSALGETPANLRRPGLPKPASPNLTLYGSSWEQRRFLLDRRSAQQTFLWHVCSADLPSIAGQVSDCRKSPARAGLFRLYAVK